MSGKVHFVFESPLAAVALDTKFAFWEKVFDQPQTPPYGLHVTWIAPVKTCQSSSLDIQKT
jgi:hypothetical protein